MFYNIYSLNAPEFSEFQCVNKVSSRKRMRAVWDE
jgi:hypothetical protein